MSQQYGGPPPGGPQQPMPGMAPQQPGMQPQPGMPQPGMAPQQPGMPQPGMAPQQPGMPQPGMAPQQPGMPQPGMAPGAAAMMPQAAGMQPTVGAAVCGEALQQGERVVYYRAMDYSTSKTIYLVIGILFMPLLFIGAIFLWMRSRIDKDNPSAIAVTSHRLLIQQGTGMTTTHWLQNLADVEPIRAQARASGGGLVGALVAAGVSAALNSMADKKAKTDPKYWNRAVGVTLIDQQGNESEVRCQEKPKEMIDLGLFIAQGMYQGGFSHYPEVPFAG